MTTGDPAVDAQLAQLAVEAPEFNADQFSVISSVLKRAARADQAKGDAATSGVSPTEGSRAA